MEGRDVASREIKGRITSCQRESREIPEAIDCSGGIKS